MAVIVTFSLYSAFSKKQSASNNTPLPVPTVTSVPTTVSSFAAPPVPQVTTIPPTNGLKDGEYTGEVADALYGNIQVKAVIQNGQITDVQFLQYPNDRDTSIEINTAAMPILKSEAIQAQSENVDVVTGATDTSHAFIQSMKSALNKAKS